MFNPFVQDKDKFMKKTFALATTILLFPLTAQSADNSFYDDILVNAEMKAQEEAEQKANAKRQELRKIGQEAGKLLEADIPQIDINLSELAQFAPDESTQKRANVANLTPAPLGLNWGSTVFDVQKNDVTLTPIEEKDYPNSYSAQNLPKPVRDFRQVNLSFGTENELWRIIAYGKFFRDTPSAEFGLREYKKFYQLLDRKYGSAKEYYNPRPSDLDIDMDGTTNISDNSIGNADFLSDLQVGGAELYSIFANEEVEATLALKVDGTGESFITINYKNLRILRQREEQTLDAL